MEYRIKSIEDIEYTKHDMQNVECGMWNLQHRIQSKCRVQNRDFGVYTNYKVKKMECEDESIKYRAQNVDHRAEAIEHRLQGIWYRARSIEYSAQKMAYRAQSVEHVVQSMEYIQYMNI